MSDKKIITMFKHKSQNSESLLWALPGVLWLITIENISATVFKIITGHTDKQK